MQFHGRRGVVDVDSSTIPRQATKKALDKNRYGAIRKETDILKKLATQDITYVPQVIDSGDGWFSYIWITGESFDKVFPLQDLTTQHRLIHEFLDKAYELDKLGIIHGELDRPMSNILINTEKLANNEPSISFIDFERGYWQDFSGKNLRHALQRLQRLGYITADQCKSWGQLPAAEVYTNLQNVLATNPTPKRSFQDSMVSIAGLSIFGIILDQLSKYVFYNLERGAEQIWLTPLLNTGIGRSIPVPLSVVITITVGILFRGVWRIYTSRMFSRWVIFFLAGAIGNLIDRILLGGVRDFIDLHWWPVFNFADIFLTVACLLLVRETLLKKEPKSLPNAS